MKGTMLPIKMHWKTFLSMSKLRVVMVEVIKAIIFYMDQVDMVWMPSLDYQQIDIILFI